MMQNIKSKQPRIQVERNLWKTSFVGVMTQGVYKKDEEFKFKRIKNLNRKKFVEISLMSSCKDYIKRLKEYIKKTQGVQ